MVQWIGADMERYALGDFDAHRFQRTHLFGIVGDQPDTVNPERIQDASRATIVTRIVGEAE